MPRFTEPFEHSPRSAQAPYAYRGRKGALSGSAEWIVTMDDFIHIVSTNVPNGWEAAIIDTGATLVQDTTAGQGGGVVEIASDDVSEGVSIYLPATVQLAGKKWFMEVRGKVTDADDQDFQFGLTDLTATTNPEDLWTTASADFIAFGILDGDATPVLVYDTNNGGPVTETPDGTSFDLEDDTYVTLALEGIGTDSVIKAYVNGQLAATSDTQASVPDDLLLAPFIGARTGGDAAHLAHFDYMRFSLER